jgi:Icc-related predicted phosphoesterase
MKNMKKIKNIDKHKVKVRKLKVVGFGGYLDPDIYFTDYGRETIGESKTRNKERWKEYVAEEKRLMKLMKFCPDIVLAHYTPYKCLDILKGDTIKAFKGKNLGVSSYNRAIDKYTPTLFVCGHMHQNQGICKLGETTIVNPGSASEGKMAIINFDEENKKIMDIKLIR